MSTYHAHRHPQSPAANTMNPPAAPAEMVPFSPVLPQGTVVRVTLSAQAKKALPAGQLLVVTEARMTAAGVLYRLAPLGGHRRDLFVKNVQRESMTVVPVASINARSQADDRLTR